MRIDVTKAEFESIVDALKGLTPGRQRKLREQLAQRLDWQLHPGKAPESNGWAPMHKAPIRSSWPSGLVKKDKKTHWSFHKPRPKSNKPPKTPKKPPTADEILASI